MSCVRGGSDTSIVVLRCCFDGVLSQGDDVSWTRHVREDVCEPFPRTAVGERVPHDDDENVSFAPHRRERS